MKKNKYGDIWTEVIIPAIMFGVIIVAVIWVMYRIQEVNFISRILEVLSK